MMDELVLSTVEGPIARLTLNAPERANVLSSAMTRALSEALTRAAGEADVRVIVLGAAGRIFCAGHDLEELRDGTNGPSREALFEQCSALMMAIGASRAPVIARVQGGRLRQAASWWPVVTSPTPAPRQVSRFRGSTLACSARRRG
jgi:enoyl-CoA hydratase/carnithine racemase